MKEFIIGAGIVVALFTILLWGVNDGIARNEIHECQKWQGEAAQYGDRFYLVQWQADQCRAHSIAVNASIR